MKIITEISLYDFNACSGAKTTQDKIIEEDKVEEFDKLIKSIFPEGLTATKLNDILWFEKENIYKILGIYDETDE